MRAALIATARRVETSRLRVFSGILETQNAAQAREDRGFWVVLPSDVKEKAPTCNAGSRRQPISENRRQHRGKTPYRTRSERSGRVFRCLRLKTPMASRLDTMRARGELGAVASIALGSKVLDERDFLVAERPNFIADGSDHAEQRM